MLKENNTVMLTINKFYQTQNTNKESGKNMIGKNGINYSQYHN